MDLFVTIPDKDYKRIKTPRCANLIDAFNDRSIFIQAIQNGIPVNQSPDIVDRNELITQAENMISWHDNPEETEYVEGANEILGAIKTAPPAKIPDPKIAVWMENEHGTGYCPNCELGIFYRKETGRVLMLLYRDIIRIGYQFCPHCGTKMILPPKSEVTNEQTD